MKRLNFTQFKEPILKEAKRRGVKISNKNLARIHGLYLNEYIRRYGGGFNNLLRGVYEEGIEAAFNSPGPSLFQKLCRADGWDGERLFAPIGGP